jgi:TolA-binding protein
MTPRTLTKGKGQSGKRGAKRTWLAPLGALLFALLSNVSAANTNAVSQAEWLFRAGKYAEAIPLFQQELLAAADADSAGRALFHIGQCLTATRRYKEAVAAFDNLLSRYPTSSWADDALLRKGCVQAGFLRNASAGIATWRELIRSYPLSDKAPEAYFYLGAIQWVRGQRSSAREEFQALARRFPQHPLSERARLYLQP